MAEFFPQERISDPQRLFGRESDLLDLISATETKVQLQIIGARRFGKTTIALCLETILRNNKNSNVYPLYTDVKTAGVKGCAQFYRYLTSTLVVRLASDRVFRSKVKFGLYSVRPSREYFKVFSELSDVPDGYMHELFIRITEYFAEKLNKTILVIFDEFEYLATSTFYDNLEGFCPLRDFSTNRLSSGLRPFFFWLVGARPWGTFVRENKLSKVDVIGGSGEFNGVEIEHYLSPISNDAFLAFWQTRCDEYYGMDVNASNFTEKEQILSLGQRVYDSISGVPFYGNAIAKHIKAFKTFPDYTCIKSHLDEALGIFDSNTLTYMRSLCSPHIVAPSETYETLKRYGLVSVMDDGASRISMGYLRDYLVNKLPVAGTKSVEKEALAGIEDLINNRVNDINELITFINESFRGKRGKAVFETPEQSMVLNDDRILRSVCKSAKDFGQLVSTVYLMYYERSKAQRYDSRRGCYVMQVGQRLYEVEGNQNYRNRGFFRIIEPLRAAYSGAHIAEKLARQTELGELDQFDALEQLKGNRNSPAKHEWPQLHLKILELFKSELEIIKQKVFDL